MKNSMQAIILAAGKSTRFNSTTSKLLTSLCGQPIILFLIQLCEQLEIDTTVVVGHDKEAIISVISAHNTSIACTFITQKEQYGTGHALTVTAAEWHKDTILVINGDMPLVTQNVIQELYRAHYKDEATISFVSTKSNELTHSYGRVIEDETSIRIIEAKDCLDTLEYSSVNAGIYLINKNFLNEYISSLDSNNASNEFYITDLVALASNNGKKVTHVTASFDHVRGINTFQELHSAEFIKNRQLIQYHIAHGVRFICPETTTLDATVTIAPETIIEPGVYLKGSTHIGKECIIKAFSRIENSILDDQVTIESHSLLIDSYISKELHLQPFTYIRNNNIISPCTHAHKTQELPVTTSITKSHVSSSATHEYAMDQFSFIGARRVNNDIPFDEQ